MTGAVAAQVAGVQILWDDFSGNNNADVRVGYTATLMATWSDVALDDMRAICSASGNQNLFTTGSTFSIVAGENVHFDKGGGGGAITVTISDLGGNVVDTFVT